MNNTDQARQNVTISVSEGLLEQFKRIVSLEGLSMASIIGHFLANYVNYLDKGFLDQHEELNSKKEKTPFYVNAWADIYQAFKNKTFEENVSMSAVVEQFMKNYVEFMYNKGFGKLYQKQKDNDLT